jgi:hypothetical protein
MAPKNLTTLQCIHEQFTFTFTYTRDVYRVKWWKTWNSSRPINLCSSSLVYTDSNRKSTICTGVFLFSFFLPWRTSLNGPRLPHCRGFIITLRHTTLGRTPLDELTARRRDLYFTTHNTRNRQAGIHVPGWIRTSKRAATVPRLRSHGHWDRHVLTYTSLKSCSTVFQMGRSCRIAKNHYQHHSYSYVGFESSVAINRTFESLVLLAMY